MLKFVPVSFGSIFFGLFLCGCSSTETSTTTTTTTHTTATAAKTGAAPTHWAAGPRQTGSHL